MYANNTDQGNPATNIIVFSHITVYLENNTLRKKRDVSTASFNFTNALISAKIT